jgi:hypothetical protein
MFWSSAGWKRPPEAPLPKDAAYATKAGYLFEEVSFGHDELVERIVSLGSELSLDEASGSLLASLSTRNLFLRPFLPSLVIARSMPKHKFRPTRRQLVGGPDTGPCDICNVWAKPLVTVEPNVLNFERHKWGGVRHLDPVFVWFCLDRFRAEGGAAPEPIDIDLFRDVLTALGSCAPSTSMSRAEPLLKIIKSSEQERHALLEALSVISVLQNPIYPGFLDTFPTTKQRPLPNRRFVDRGYPGEWWTGADGVNQAAVAALFPQI